MVVDWNPVRGSVFPPSALDTCCCFALNHVDGAALPFLGCVYVECIQCGQYPVYTRGLCVIWCTERDTRSVWCTQRAHFTPWWALCVLPKQLSPVPSVFTKSYTRNYDKLLLGCSCCLCLASIELCCFVELCMCTCKGSVHLSCMRQGGSRERGGAQFIREGASGNSWCLVNSRSCGCVIAIYV